ncbi:MAG: hypothetical protein IK115_00565 [Lachnospiraceae bacterium]|nr:hypothetical protein [Lachnospiraceae bacterium]
MEKLKKYKDADTLDRELTAFMIEKIEVFGKNKVQVTHRFEELMAGMERTVSSFREAI